MSSINNSVNKQFEKMFNIFNKEFFENELEMPLFRFQSKGKYNGRNYNGYFNNNAIIRQGRKYSHEIVIPIELLDNDIDEIAACLLHNMIHYYAFIKDCKVCSNNDFYHNKKFKNFADECGLKTEYMEVKGWVTSSDKNFAELCKKYGFKKTWENRYVAMCKNGKKPSSTRKYICPCCGNIIRATKEVNVVCGDCHVKFIKDRQ